MLARGEDIDGLKLPPRAKVLDGLLMPGKYSDRGQVKASGKKTLIYYWLYQWDMTGKLDTRWHNEAPTNPHEAPLCTQIHSKVPRIIPRTHEIRLDPLKLLSDSQGSVIPPRLPEAPLQQGRDSLLPRVFQHPPSYAIIFYMCFIIFFMYGYLKCHCRYFFHVYHCV